MATLRAIPLDVISLIVEQHLFDDASTLQACSLVARSFLVPSRKGIFHTIHLDHVLKAQEQCQKLYRVFSDNFAISTYVREIYVLDYDTDTLGCTPRTPYLSSRVKHWASGEETLHAILQMLPNLRLLSFKFSEDAWSPNEWRSLSAELKLALGRVLTLPTLTVCKLEGVDNIPSEWFDAYRSLKELSLTAVSVLPDRMSRFSSSSIRSRNAQLERLELADICDDIIFEAMRASVDISQLREVSVRSDNPNVIWEATKDATGTLEMLTWDYYGDDVGFNARNAGNISLAAFPKLRFLRLTTEVYVGLEFDILLWLAQSLREVGSTVADGVSNLEEIAVYLDCATFQEQEEVRMFQLQNSIWKDVDVLLTTSGKFSKLRKFDLYICHLPDPGPGVLRDELGVESIEQWFCGYMSGLFRIGLLHVHHNNLEVATYRGR